MRPRDPDAFFAAIGTRVVDRALLMTALTHGSASDASRAAGYQRLEFLGDRVLGVLVAEMLYRRYPAADEGELALRYNGLVRRETLADIARTFDLGAAIVIGPGEEQAGGRDKDAILADVLEAVLGAVYLEGGLEAARGIVERGWGERIASASGALRDPKTALQEWSQARGFGLPVYVEVGREGPPHAPVFTIEVRLAGRAPATAVGASKREAERRAAQVLLAREQGDEHA